MQLARSGTDMLRNLSITNFTPHQHFPFLFPPLPPLSDLSDFPAGTLMFALIGGLFGALGIGALHEKFGSKDDFIGDALHMQCLVFNLVPTPYQPRTNLKNHM